MADDDRKILTMELEVGPAFRANAIAALTALLQAQQRGPTWDVLKKLQQGLTTSRERDPDAAPIAPSTNTPDEFAHLDVDSEPKTAAEAFWMASQWGHRWSEWNRFASAMGGNPEAIVLCAQADAAQSQRLIAIGMGLVLKEALAEGLGGIEDRLSEIRDGVRD
jgi:hypothetical protein